MVHNDDDDNPYLSFGEAIEIHSGQSLASLRLAAFGWVTKEVAAAKPLTYGVCTDAQRREYVLALITEATISSAASRTPTTAATDALEQLFSLVITTPTVTKLLLVCASLSPSASLLEPSSFKALLTGLTTAVSNHRQLWPAPTTVAGVTATESKSSSPSPSSSLSQLAATSPTHAYASLKTIRHYLNIIYTTIATQSHDTSTIVPLLMAAQCGTLPLLTFLFELLPSSNSIHTPTDDGKPAAPAADASMDLNTVLPWKKVILLIRQLVLILVVPPVACPPPRTGNTPGTCVDGSRTPATAAATGTATAKTPSALSMPVQYGVKTRLNDLRDACAEATLRFSPVAFFPGDRFTPPDFIAMSDLPADVRERLEYLKANLYPRHSSYTKPPRRCPPLPLRKPPPAGSGEISAAAAAIHKKSQRAHAGSGHRPAALFDINSESICEPTNTPSSSPFDDPDFWNDPTVGKTNGGTSSAQSSTAAGTRFSFDRTPPSRTRGLSGATAPSSAEKKLEEKQPEWCAPVQPIATQVYRHLLAGRGLQTYITGLLKVLLTAGARTDLHNDRLALDLRHEVIIPSQLGACDKLAAIELPRHRQIIIDSIAFTLLILLKSYRSNDVIQFNFLRSVLNHRNAGVVILKTLSHPLAKPYATATRDIFSISRPADTTSDAIATAILTTVNATERKVAAAKTDAMNGATDHDTWQSGSRTVGNGDVPVSNSLSRPIIGYINLIRVLQKLTKRSPAHVLMMHHIKVPALLTKILQPSSPPLLRFYALKLTKSLVRYQSAQWRTDNSAIISEIYSTLRLDACDDWMKSHHETKPHYDDCVRTLQAQRVEYEAYNAKLATDAAEAASMAPSLEKAAATSAAALLTVSDEQLRREYDQWIHDMDQELLDEAIDELQDDSPPPSPKEKTKPTSTKSVTIMEPPRESPATTTTPVALQVV